MLKRTGQIGIILFTLILVTSLLVFTGCGKKVNLKGANIKVGSFWQTYNTDTYEPRDEGEAQGLEWRIKIQKDNGFTMEVVTLGDWDTYVPLAVNAIMSGDKSISAYDCAPVHAITLYKNGLLYPISDSTAVNWKNREQVAYETPMYNGLVEGFMTFGGKTYGWNNGLPNNSWGQAMLFFNVNHLEQVGLSPDYLYDLQKNNNWTWDAFLEVCRRLTRDTNNDGVTDIYAVHMDDAREFLRGLIFGNGGNFVTFDSQGKAQSAVNSPAVIEALQFYNQLINEGLIMTTEAYDWGQNWTAFVDQRVAMTFDPEWRKGQGDDFVRGYVLPPRGPRSSTLRMDATDNVYVVPNIFSPQEVDVIVKAIELWNTPTTTDWVSSHYWASHNLRDATETVVMSRDARYLTPRNFGLIPGYPMDDFINEFRNGLGQTNPAQHIESWQPRFQATLDDFNR